MNGTDDCSPRRNQSEESSFETEIINFQFPTHHLRKQIIVLTIVIGLRPLQNGRILPLDLALGIPAQILPGLITANHVKRPRALRHDDGPAIVVFLLRIVGKSVLHRLGQVELGLNGGIVASGAEDLLVFLADAAAGQAGFEAAHELVFFDGGGLLIGGDAHG